MLIKCPKGYYHLERNFRDAFNEEAFCEAYLEECFDNDLYIVGDISAGLLRLKGFNNDPKSPNYYGFIDDYLEVSCVIGSPYYVLKRIKESDYDKLKDNEKLSKTDESGFVINTLEKENFDKESLVLNSNPKEKPNIDIDMKKINSIPQGKLPEYLKEDKKEQKESSSFNKIDSSAQVQSYVSSSNGFDPSKVQNRGNNFNRNRNKENNKDNNNKKNNNNTNNKDNKNNKHNKDKRKDR